MGLLSFISMVVGIFLGGLIALAALVAGWELLRQRELIDRMRRDRAAFAATSPLPLSPSAQGCGRPAPLAAPLDSEAAAHARAALAAAARAPRDRTWVETRPTVLSFAPAADDDAPVRQLELDLILD